MLMRIDLCVANTINTIIDKEMINFLKRWDIGLPRNNDDMHRYYIVEYGNVEGKRLYNNWRVRK